MRKILTKQRTKIIVALISFLGILSSSILVFNESFTVVIGDITIISDGVLIAVIIAAVIVILGFLFINFRKPANKSGSGTNISVTGKKKGDKTNYDLRGVSNATINHYQDKEGFNTKEIRGLLKIIDEKNIALDKRNDEFEELAKKHNELEKHYAERSVDSDISKRAKERIDEGDYESAEKLFAKSLENNLQISAEKNQAAASDAYELALLNEIQLEYEDAKKYYEKAVELDPDNPLYLSGLAHILEVLGKYAEAEPLYQQALKINENKLGNDHPDVATTLNNLAVLYESQGKYDQALPLLHRTLKIREDKFGKDHPDVAAILNNLAMLYESQGKYDEALPLFQRALEIKENKLGNDHPSFATTLNNLATLYKSQGKYDKALPFFQRALKIAEKALGADHSDTRLLKSNLADLMAEINKQ